MLCHSYYAYVFSSTKLEKGRTGPAWKRAEMVEGKGEGEGGRGKEWLK
jgi:hypothetical protein